MLDLSLHLIGPEQLAEVKTDAKLDIIFVHGLGGDAVDTWSATKTPDDFWPRWLAKDFSDANVWSVGYSSSALKSLGTPGLSLITRAQSLLDLLVSNEIGSRRIIFITHSLGGLLVKQMLRKCHEAVNPEYKAVLKETKGVVFCGTPHQGSALAKSLVNIFAAVASTHVKQLAENNETLLDLHEFFRNLCVNNGVRVGSYHETKKVGGLVMVVDAATANPLIPGCEPVPISADHFAVCKPDTHEHPLYVSIKHLIAAVLNQAPIHQAPSRFSQSAGTWGALVPAALSGLGNLPSLPGPDQRKVMVIDAPDGKAAEIYVAPLPEIMTDFEYFTTPAPGDRRTLSEKLEAADREVEIKEAERQKERFAKTLFRSASQRSSLVRYTKLMSEIESRYRRQVRPLVMVKAGELTINKAIQAEIIEPVLKMQEAQTEDVTSAVIESALYYLTGNCHVRWDPE